MVVELSVVVLEEVEELLEQTEKNKNNPTDRIKHSFVDKVLALIMFFIIVLELKFQLR